MERTDYINLGATELLNKAVKERKERKEKNKVVPV